MARPSMIALLLAIAGLQLGAASDDPLVASVSRILDGAAATTAAATTAATTTVAPATVAPATAAPPPAVTTTAAPAVVSDVPTTVAGCAAYLQGTGCAWTLKYNCPLQAAGTNGLANNDGTIGYTCCCKLEQWKNVAPAPAPVVETTPNPGIGQPQRGVNSLAYETIPRAIKLKYKLMQWFESQKQCPLNLQGGFPAWVGWKAVTAAAPAVTTPPKTVAGNRTLMVYGMCKRRQNDMVVNGIQSKSFNCIKTDKEVKARAIEETVKIRLDNVWCTLKDISLYRMDDGFTGVRFDFGTCVGDSAIGAAAPHVPTTASLNMGLTEERNVPEVNQTKFGDFFKAVCGNGPAADFQSSLLPKFTRSRASLGPVVANTDKPQPACFAESANTAHVIGKGCFQDFIFFDLQDVNGKMAMIPTADVAGLNQMIPARQHWRNPAPVPAPVPGAPSPAMVAVPAPGTAPEPVPNNPCAPQKPNVPNPCKPQKPTCASYTCPLPWVQRPNADRYLCLSATGCSKKDLTTCCLTPTTTTTTPFNQEVPGVVVADRVCIFFDNCGSCTNYCDCKIKPPKAFTTTTPPIMWPVCEDYPLETSIIGVIAFFLSFQLSLFVHERCVKPAFKDIKYNGKAKTGKSMTQTLESMHAGTGTILDRTISKGVNESNYGYGIKTETTTISYSGWSMSFTNFFTTCLISFCAVHTVYWLWQNFCTYVLNMTNDQYGLNSIVFRDCPFSLWGVWVSIWFINWCSLTYYYGWQTETYTKHTATGPMQVEGSMLSGGGGGGMLGWIFGGSSF